MANQKISALDELTTPATADEIEIVDKSDTSAAASGTNKRITVATLDTRYADTAAITAAKAALAGVYQTILRATGRATTAGASGTTYPLVSGQSDQSAVNASSTNAAAIPVLRLVATDLAVSGLTTKLQVRASVLTVTAAPAITYTFGLYPITIASQLIVPGTVVSGSTVAIASPSSNTVTTGVATTITLPSDGPFILAYTLSGTPSGNATVQAVVQAHSV